MPLPAIEDVFQKLGESELFCVMDITKGFWNVPISPESRKHTAFTLRNIGLFEYLVMPMGLRNSPVVLSRGCVNWSFLHRILKTSCSASSMISASSARTSIR
jgi:hypothetical protein